MWTCPFTSVPSAFVLTDSTVFLQNALGHRSASEVSYGRLRAGLDRRKTGERSLAVVGAPEVHIPRTMNGKARDPRQRYTRRGFLRVAAAGVAATTCGGLFTACGDSRLARKLRVTPNPVAVDEPFTVTMKDLSPWQRVT